MKNKNISQLNFFLILSSFALIGIKWSILPPEIPLFYSRPWGEEQLASKLYVFLLPAISVVIFYLNRAIANFFDKKRVSFLVITSKLVSLAITILCFISLFKIIFLIT